MQTPHNLVPTDWMSWEQHVNLRSFVQRIEEENCYTPDLPELLQYDFHYLFTYGSLKRGFCRSSVLRDCEVMGSGFTLDDEYIMHRTVGRANPFPIIFPHIGPQRGVIHGELYKVHTSIIPYLDMMESNGVLYERQLIPTQIRVRGTDVIENVNAWCYVGNAKGWTKYMNQQKIALCDRQTKKLHASSDYYIYMRKYEKEYEQEQAA